MGLSKKIRSKSRGQAKPAPVFSPTAQSGLNNQWYSAGNTEIIQGNTYSDLSTVCFVATRGTAAVRVYKSWNDLMKPMNQKWAQLFIVKHEVGEAYEEMVNILRATPDLQKWKYVLTLEEDNMPPPDGLLKLYEDIKASKCDAVGGLYWTKGHGTGKPMCYGKADVTPRDFVPWLPEPNSVARCHGLGMGFTLFKMGMFLDERFERPLFKTEQSYQQGQGSRMYTQDLRFFENAGKLGYKVACSTRCLVGHYDFSTDTVF